MKLMFFLLLIIFYLPVNMFAGEENAVPEKKSKLEFISAVKKSAPAVSLEYGTREFYALVLSSLIPGSGQTYLGHEYKGAAITLGFVGTTIGAVIAHNNFLAREDRIEVLTRDYNQASEFSKAEQLWRQIKTEENNRKYDNERRAIFGISAAVIWVYNIIDILFLTDDKGEDVFASNSPSNIDFITGADFSGIALKINLP